MNDEENALWRGFEARIERLEDIARDFDEVLRGDRRKRIIGLLAEHDRMDKELTKLNAVVFMDSTGKHGLAHDVDVLMDRRTGKDRRSQFLWGFWTAITVAVISSGTAILTNWDKIKANLPKYHPGPLEQKIEQAKRPKGKTLYKVRHVQAEAPSESTKESNPP